MKPSRIRRMSRRRQKIAIARYISKSLTQAWNEFVGIPFDRNVHIAMVDAGLRALEEIVPNRLSCRFTIYLPDGTQKEIQGATFIAA